MSARLRTIGLGSAAAYAGGPVVALWAIAAFALGRTITLLAAAGYYLFQVLTGDVIATVPGDPGSGTLP